MKKKKKRLVVRTGILIVLFGALIFTLYQGLFTEKVIVQAGEAAPNFSLETFDGDRIELADLKGKGVVVNFWGTYCEPCEREMPAIEAAFQAYKDKGVEVLAVNVKESKMTVAPFIERMETSFPVLMDKHGDVMEAYGIDRLPATYVLDENGNVIHRKIGEMTAPEINQYMEDVLPSK
ncbi:thiol-disulfide oxidoreductase ResA [Aureibacillus halotolerans]|uniref:Peroxiredoxin n=1 Tax=Aureibacillus halotolerans TaxID=1508390 RepID=A0A4V3D5W8_9BACI|nr:thiol-disulfide oxidoreductase ResA [Aureibacillus halotolerans]TDQ41577.1 peroxiredoxin [Aureibacillus halotolerans]